MLNLQYIKKSCDAAVHFKSSLVFFILFSDESNNLLLHYDTFLNFTITSVKKIF
jgi:hypothetical protein